MQENELAKDEALAEAPSLAMPVGNPYPVIYYMVPIVFLTHPHQTMPVAVVARNLPSPQKSAQRSASGSRWPPATPGDDEHAHSYYMHHATLYASYGVLAEDLNEDCEVTKISPAEAISRSLFSPPTDPRFTVAGRTLIFTSSHSKRYWLHQCRQGIEFANFYMASRSSPLSGIEHLPSFIPVDSRCPLIEKLILESSVLGDSIVYGAKRWMAVVSDDFCLYREARSCKVLSLLGGSWRPLSFATSTAKLATLFIACVYLEASCTRPCYDWETKEDLALWIWKHSVVGEVREMDWALHSATMAKMYM